MILDIRYIKYPTYEQVVWLYDRVVEISDGGIKGFRDEGELLYVLEMVKNDLYFPSFMSKLSLISTTLSYNQTTCS